MLTVSEQITIARPPAEIFPLAADPLIQLEWDAGTLKRVEKLNPGPLAQGARYRGEAKGFGRFEYEFVEYDPPLRFAHHASVAIGDIRHTFAFEAVPDGTRLTQSIQFTPKGIGRLLRPLMPFVLRRRLRQVNTEINRYLINGGTAEVQT
jgi:Polyketide cyclase / dehydrase and lipid transport